MRVARQDPADISQFTAWLIGFSMPRTVPSAWSGLVPPVTMTGRHRKLDEYVAGNPWHQPTGTGVFVDLGCGFPPFTTMDTANRLSDWQVIGVDPAFGRYLVLDADGTYACFDEALTLLYYQQGNFDPDSAGTRARFREILNRLLPKLEVDDQTQDDRGTLIRDPMRCYETDNLELKPGKIGDFTLPNGADVVRCMNVFMYFDHPFRKRALDWVTGLLKPGGLFICGSNWTDSASSRYTVYRKEADRLEPKEFALSIENVRPIELAPWYALHDDNLENLANAHTVGTLRADEDFRHRIDKKLDALLAERACASATRTATSAEPRKACRPTNSPAPVPYSPSGSTTKGSSTRRSRS